MTRIAYLDIIGGISGDMLISAMLDAGLPRHELETELAKIVPGPFTLNTSKTTRGAISATHTDVVVPNEKNRKMGWSGFYACIDRSALSELERTNVRAIFDCLRVAEADAHDTLEGDSHLHELGTLDTLIDIAAAVVGLRILAIDTLYASALPASYGMSSSSHGKGASIAPATMSIIKNYQIPVRISGSNLPTGESITPTGAAIVATLAEFSPANILIENIGYGAGTRNTDTPPNVVGLWLGQPQSQPATFGQTADDLGLIYQSDVVLIESNIDDMTGEELGYATAILFENGAVDVWTTPIQMKKSRPAVTLSAIADQSDLGPVTTAFFQHTSTLGIRVRQLNRLIAEREVVTVETQYGTIQVKLRLIDGNVTQTAPEFDDCARIASELDIPIREVMDAAKRAASKIRN